MSNSGFKKSLKVDGFDILVEAVEVEGHKANIKATASRAGKALGRSRALETKLSFVGLFSMQNDGKVKSLIRECAIPMALSDAKANLQSQVPK